MEYYVRVISDANLLEHPDNSSNAFINNIRPTIIDVKSIGICEFVFNIKWDERLNDPIFFNDNSFFFINCDLIAPQHIANQSSNSLNEVSINLSDYISENKLQNKIIYKFTSDFLYLDNSSDKEIENITILVTNLNGEPHPLLFSSTVVILKYRTMEINQELIRVVSTANLSENPNNTASDFKNNFRPAINKVDSIGLSKISIPIRDYFVAEGSFTNKQIINTGLDSGFTVGQNIFDLRLTFDDNSAINLDFIVSYSDLLGQKRGVYNTDTLTYLTKDIFYVRGYTEDDRRQDNQPYLYIESDPSATYGYTICARVGTNENKTITRAFLTNTTTQNNADGSKIYFAGNPDIVYSEDKKTVKLLNSLIIIPRLPNPFSSMWINDNGVSTGDVLLITCEGVEGISYGPFLIPILGIINVTKSDLESKRLNFTVPLACFYALKTNNSILESLRIIIVNENLEQSDIVDETRTTLATFVVNHKDGI